MNPIERMKWLINIVDEASRAYYQDNREIMSNREYDALYDELEALEKETGVRLSNSPTAKVGYEVVGSLKKIPHDAPMLSLDKTKETAKLVSFLGDKAGLLSWKLDGLTIVLKYDEGKLVQAVTRGNGIIGEDVTHTARVFANLPIGIAYSGVLSVRGEAVISNSDFERINETISEPGEKYKNPRNLCSGTVRQLNSEIAAGRRVRFYAFGLVDTGFESAVNPLNLPPADLKSRQLEWLAAQGFTVVEHRSVIAETVENAVNHFKENIDKQIVASDGLVLTYDDIPYGSSLGATSKFPRDAIAFKWDDEIRETTLLRIDWNTSRTGLINPVAVFEPVELEGTTVKQASLHNVSIVKGLQLGEGDRITVYKANMIIPQVAENLTRSGTLAIPDKCPVCGFETEISTSTGSTVSNATDNTNAALNECEALYCLNPNCKAQLISGLAHFCSRDAMNIEGLSEQTLDKFTNKGFVSDYTDLFALNRYQAEIMQMEGFGKKSFDNLMLSVEKAKDTKLPNFIYALGIKHVGLSNAKLLCRHYAHDMERVIQSARGEHYKEELLSIKGFGEVIAHSLHVYFSDDKNLSLMRKALTHLRIIKPAASDEAEKRPLEGITVVITGDLQYFISRSELQAFIEKHGGRVTSSVTKKTSFLINNDNTSASAKNKKAAELGVTVLTEEAFLNQFGLSQ